jgi:membrane-associated phospholipid phosphatase
MLFSKRVSSFFINFVLLFAVFSTFDVVAYPNNKAYTDSTCLHCTSFSNVNQDNTNTQIPSTNFYKTDSIFSFQSRKGYVPSLLYNFGEQVTAPFRFKTKQWIFFGAATGITAVLLHFDNNIDKWARVQKQDHGWVKKSSPVITQFGSIYGISSVAAIGFLSAAFNKQKGVETSLLATQALITSGAWVQLIKHFTGREDPSASYIYSKIAGGKWWGPFAQYDQDLPVYKSVSSFDAFPSGHTAAAFSIATVFATRYSDIKAIPILSYSLATLVGISRLTEHAHWTSDIFVGGLIGYICGKQVVAGYDKVHQNPGNALSSRPGSKSEFSFIQNGNQIGFFIRW